MIRSLMAATVLTTSFLASDQCFADDILKQFTDAGCENLAADALIDQKIDKHTFVGYNNYALSVQGKRLPPETSFIVKTKTFTFLPEGNQASSIDGLVVSLKIEKAKNYKIAGDRGFNDTIWVFTEALKGSKCDKLFRAFEASLGIKNN